MIKLKDIVLNAEFKTSIGTVKITHIVKDGYGKGDDIIYTSIDGVGMYANDREDLTAFINENK